MRELPPVLDACCDPRMMSADAVERARRYAQRMEGAVSGAGGHDRTFRVACTVVHGFALGEEEAMAVLLEWNAKCAPPWTERELRHKVRGALRTTPRRERGWLLGGRRREEQQEERKGAVWTHRAGRTDVARGAEAAAGQEAPPPAKEDGREGYNEAALRRCLLPGVEVDEEFLRERSPVDVAGVTTEDFLRAVFRAGERVLVFTNERTQGSYGWSREVGWVQLEEEAPRQGVHRDRQPWRCRGRRVAEGPRSARCGVWYLAQPVDGCWHWLGDGEGKWSRRSWQAVTDWRHMVLESDEVPADLYLNWLVQQRLPIAAIYTSGGRSVHALLRWAGVRTKPQWDALRDMMRGWMMRVGVDGRTLTAVRLTRLPGCLREGKATKDGGYIRYREPREQALLFLDPDPGVTPIIEMPVRRRRRAREGERGASA